MYVFFLLVQSADNFYFLSYVHQILAENEGTGFRIIKHPSGRNRRPLRDRRLRPPLPLLLAALLIASSNPARHQLPCIMNLVGLFL